MRLPWTSLTRSQLNTNNCVCVCILILIAGAYLIVQGISFELFSSFLVLFFFLAFIEYYTETLLIPVRHTQKPCEIFEEKKKVVEKLEQNEN